MNSGPEIAASRFVVDVVRSFCTGTAVGPWPDLHVPGGDPVIRNAFQSGLLPLVVHQVRASGHQVPETATRLVQELAMLRLAQRSDLAAVAACLDDSGVRWLLMKGPVLDQITFRVPGLRTYVDLDVVIHPHDFERGWRALQAGPARDLDLNWARLATTEQSEISMELPRGTTLDLHWQVISNRGIRATFALDIDGFFRRAVSAQVSGRTVLTLDSLDTVLYLSMHAALSGGHELKWLVDLHQALVAAQPDFAELPARADRTGLGLVAAVMVDRLSMTLGGLPRATPRRLTRHAWWRAVCFVGGRLAPVTATRLDRYTARVLFSATRRTSASSVRALLCSLPRTRRAGLARRSGEIDLSILRTPGGTDADLITWLGVVRHEVPRRVL